MHIHDMFVSVMVCLWPSCLKAFVSPDEILRILVEDFFIGVVEGAASAPEKPGILEGM